ncbi:MAG: lipopolysaccharide heptosyltransferase I [Burkholderiaceae bacterium]|nr:lipopolysaccharide heptosyltransferase I [Burkholderiaceae bacterium]
MTHPRQTQSSKFAEVDKLDLINSTSTGSKAPKILLVKLSSLGDVLHNLPIVWDLRKRLPNAQIDWIVEEAYVPLLAPLQTTEKFRGIDRIISVAFRRWRKSLLSPSTWREFFAMRQLLQATSYDVVIETQGLLKSALVCALARKSAVAIVAGLGNATEYSGYEPLARSFYSQSVHVPVKCHAIDRSRQVMCSAFDWPLLNRADEPPRFYPTEFVKHLPDLSIEGLKKATDGSVMPYIVCFHSTARAAKRWPNESWVDLGKALANHGYQLIFPWGSAAERRESNLIASQISGAIVPKAISIEEAYILIAYAALTIGVDTGLTHLAAVLGKPTVELYCDSPRWKTEGYWSEQISNHGDLQQPPTVTEVFDACQRLIGYRQLQRQDSV